MEHEGDADTKCTWKNPQKIGTRTGRLGNKRTSGDPPDHRYIKIGQNIRKSPRNLR